MQKLALAAVSRNHFNMPVWIARHEGLDVAIELHDGVDEVTNRLRDINRDCHNAALHDLGRSPAGGARC